MTLWDLGWDLQKRLVDIVKKPGGKKEECRQNDITNGLNIVSKEL